MQFKEVLTEGMLPAKYKGTPGNPTKIDKDGKQVCVKCNKAKWKLTNKKWKNPVSICPECHDASETVSAGKKK